MTENKQTTTARQTPAEFTREAVEEFSDRILGFDLGDEFAQLQIDNHDRDGAAYVLEEVLDFAAARGYRAGSVSYNALGEDLMRVDFVPFGFRKGEGVPDFSRAAELVAEDFDGAIIGRGVEGRCRNCWGDGPVKDGDRVALYVKEKETTDDETNGPKGYDLLSLWHRDCAPEIGTRTLDETLLVGTLDRREDKEGETVEFLEDVEVLAYSPAECGVDLLATSDTPVNDTSRKTTDEEPETTRSNPRGNVREHAEDGRLAGDGGENLGPHGKVVRAAELLAEVGEETDVAVSGALNLLEDLETEAYGESFESEVEEIATAD